MVQGTFLKRHRVQNPLTGGFVGILDIAVGGSIALYGRTFNVVGCDPFTRAFLEREGLDVAPDTPYPESVRAGAHTLTHARRGESLMDDPGSRSTVRAIAFALRVPGAAN